MDTTQLVTEALDLFFEYRDRHGYDEDAAQWAAIHEVEEGLREHAGLEEISGGS